MKQQLQRVTDSKRAIATSPVIVKEPQHPILQRQAEQGNRAVNQFLAAQPIPSRVQPKFRGLSYELGQAENHTGEKLPDTMQQKMETAFDADFSDVRIHQGSTARSIGADAFTSGSDLHFASGKYNPATLTGQQLVAHELAHVVQQRSGNVAIPQNQEIPINDNPQLEQEADTLGAKAVRGEVVSHSSNDSSPSSAVSPIQCAKARQMGAVESDEIESAEEDLSDEMESAEEEVQVDNTPKARQDPNISFVEQYNPDLWNVPDREDSEYLPSSADYKNKSILAPNDQMWGMYQQRKISKLKILGNHDPNATRRVVFGTKEDGYTAYPEKYGFMGRRAIKNEPTWKPGKYETRLKQRNPRRGQIGGKNMKNQTRMDEINEESGLRVKHAPSILMINRYIKTKDDFERTYLSGAKGTRTGIAHPDHVTDHEIYRMFSGKDRKRILDNTLFADDSLTIEKVGKQKNTWKTKNQIARWWRIRNQN